jgi:hypothetical protein
MQKQIWVDGGGDPDHLELVLQENIEAKENVISDTGWIPLESLADYPVGISQLSKLQMVDADGSSVDPSTLNLGALGRCSMADTLSPAATDTL